LTPLQKRIIALSKIEDNKENINRDYIIAALKKAAVCAQADFWGAYRAVRHDLATEKDKSRFHYEFIEYADQRREKKIITNDGRPS
jgi:hypothetical protein